MPTLTITVGPPPPGRAAQLIAEWFAERARAHAGFDVEIADLAEIGLPLLDEPNHPRLGQYTKQHTKDWSAIIDRADALVFVTPEYNYGSPASAKTPIDSRQSEWKDKPVGFVSYGGIAAGTRAVQQLKQVVTTLRMVPVTDSVNIPFHAQHIKDGTFEANDLVNQAADPMLDELVRVEPALHQLRAPATQSA